MAEPPYGGHDEKEVHKQEEKSWEEKWHRDHLNAGAWAAIII